MSTFSPVATKFTAAALTCVGLLAWSGCGDLEWNWGPGRRRPIRPAAKPIQLSPPPAAAGETEQADEPPASPARPEEPTCYQLVLLSEPSSAAAPPGLKHVEVTRASARTVGELLAILYLPSGPTGTTHRYTLLYPSAVELDAAADWARQLDAPPIEEPAPQPPAGVEGAFAFGIGLLYGTPPGHADEKNRLQLAEAGLLRTLNAPNQPASRRWAAGMIAGAVRADRLEDYSRAERHYLAAGAAAPDALEQMAALYARARAHIQNGKPDAARQILDDLIARFTAFGSSEVFGRAARTLDDLGPKP